VPFPFSDLTQSKRRPALVLASPRGDDIILCQITNQDKSEKINEVIRIIIELLSANE